MSTPALDDDLDLARRAAREAAEAVIGHFRAGEPVRYKSADQPVTAADLLADRILRDRLLAARPTYGWLSEESVDDKERLSRRRVWIIDPIDGTNSFVAGYPEFVVSVGLVERGEVVVGVIHNPATGEEYYAARGAGAYRDGAAIRVGAPQAGERPVLVGSRTEIAEAAFAPLGDAWEVRPLGSTAYRMVKVADGTAHATWSGRAKHDWDVCAAALIVAEAGGRVCDATGATPRYNLPAPTHPGVVATGVVELPPLRSPWSESPG